MINKKILVIEDNAQVRDNIQEILELEDFETIAAENGVIGLKLAKEQSPDLILCDVMMPEMDGYSVLKALRTNVSTINIPFIFLTAKAEKSERQQGIELGADDYLAKPFTYSEILQIIETHLNKRRSEEKIPH